EVRHLTVDITGQFDESRLNAGLLRLPGKIERIDGNAVPAQARTRIERHEAERLCGRRVDYLPSIDPHTIAHESHFIHEAYVDHPEGVLEQFHHFGNASRADRYYRIQGLAIEQFAHL